MTESGAPTKTIDPSQPGVPIATAGTLTAWACVEQALPFGGVPNNN